MRIGLFSDTFPPDINGVANSTSILRNELKKHGHEVYVVAPRAGRGWAEWNEDHTVLRLAGIELKQLYGYVMTSPFHINALNEIRKLNLDVIHAQTEFGVGIFARICAKNLSIPLVSTYHTTYEDYTHYANLFNSEKFDQEAKRAVAYLSRLYGDSSVEVIAPSMKTKELLEKYHVRSDIHVVPTGLELDRFRPGTNPEKRAEIRNRFSIPLDAKLVIYVGRIAEEKSLDMVIDGFAEADQRGDHVYFLIVGSGPDADKEKQKVESLGLSDRIIFAGAVPSAEVADYYRCADAFVSASLSETQGMTFIEALASGLPLFARKDVVLEDLLLDGKTGWYFTDAHDLADRLEGFLSTSDEVLKQMSEAALEQVKPYSSETFYEKVLQVYHDAIDSYEHMLIVEDVRVKDDIVQLFLSDMQGGSEDIRLSMTLDDYYNEGIRKGGKLSSHQIEQIRNNEPAVMAYEGCLKRILAKDRTRKEIYDWLTRNTDCSIEAINRIVDRLEQKGYLNDERYCEENISRMKVALLGEERILRELRKRGIPAEMIQQKLAEHPDDELENAREYAEKAANSIHDDSVLMKQRKLKAKMLQRGFSSEISDSVIREMDFTEDEHNELENLRKCAQKARKRYEKKYDSTQLRNHVFRYCAAQGYQSEDIYAILDEMEWK